MAGEENVESTEEENFDQNIQQELYSEGDHTQINNLHEPIFL
jgi:hypothetical protein